MVVRKRLLFWLIKAYLKRWGKTILLSFVVGLIIFFVVLKSLDYVLPKVQLGKTHTLGLVGAYDLENLPSSVLSDLSAGLTRISPNGEILPGIAKSWEIRNNGKTYLFHLKDNQYLTTGAKITSDKINYSFTGVSVNRPDKKTISFTLKDSYSPFLVTVSRPVFQRGFIGSGPYVVKDIDLNGDFVQSITLVNDKNATDVKKYVFYPSAEAVKMGYMMGEITKASALADPYFDGKNMADFPNTSVTKSTDYSSIVSLFYNMQDPLLSDKKIRNSLSYALPDTFTEGEKAYSLYPPFFWSYTDEYEKPYDVDRAKTLLSESSATSAASITINLKVLKKYEKSAKVVQKAWKELGIHTSIELVNSVPDSFQIFLGDFHIPKDPDQYALWHSNEPNNISRYKNLRIDKYLEDGRKTIDQEERKQLYLDFQKYLFDDTPASFLYFPYEYSVTRK